MDAKSIRKGVGRFAGWFGFKVCSLIIRYIPERYIYGFAGFIGNAGYRLAKKQRTIAIDSLSIAFGKEKSRSELEQITRDCFTFLAKAGTELIFLMDRPALLKQRVTMAGIEYLDGALKYGKGVILVSAHFGNFPLLMARLALGGYKIGGIMRQMRDARMEKIFLEKRNRLNIKTIYSQPRSACVSNTIEALRNNEIVFTPIDQNFGTGGVFVNFFGRKAATATGPVILAQRTKAAIVPCFIVREPQDTHKIIFEPALNIVAGSNSEETVLINIHRLTDIIESYIRRYPAEWGWIHRRWKSQPG